MTCTLKAMHPEDFLTLDGWHRLLKAAQSAREAALPRLLGGAGLRVSEVAELKVEHIDSAGSYLQIINSKGGSTVLLFSQSQPRGSTRPLKRISNNL
jgi:integrase